MTLRLRPFVFAGLALLPLGAASRTMEVSASAGSPRALRFEAGTHGDFVAHARGGALSFDEHGATLALRDTSISLRVADGRDVAPVASETLRTRVNYLKGPRAEWRQNVPTFGKITYPGVRDGVDLVFHGEEGQVEYDFVVAPGTDPSDIALEVGGAEGLELTPDGELAIATTQGTLIQQRPRIYQGARTIEGRYRLVGNRIAFEIGNYDHDAPLVIDPVIAYATFLGGASAELGEGIVADGAEAFITGLTSSDGSQFTPAGTTQIRAGGGQAPNDVFVAKLAADGSLAWITYYGGDGNDEGVGITVDASHQPWVVGVSTSSNLSLPPNAFKSTPDVSLGDAFLLGLTADGSAIAYATLIDIGTNDTGGHHYAYGDTALALAIDGGLAYVTGQTSTAGAIHDPADPSLPGVFVAALTMPTDGVTPGLLTEKTMLGGHSAVGTGIAVHNGRVFIAGAACDVSYAGITPTHIREYSSDASCESFVTRLDASTFDVTYGTWLGGLGSDVIRGMALGKDDNMYVAGTVTSTPGDTFPVTRGDDVVLGQSAVFAARVDTDANSLAYAILISGTDEDVAVGIAVDGAGNAALVGSTTSVDFLGAGQTGHADGDGYLVRLDPTGGVTDSRYYGGIGSNDNLSGVSWTDQGIFVVGSSSGPVNDLPNTHSAQPDRGGSLDVIVARFADPSPPPPDAGTTTPPNDAGGTTTNPPPSELGVTPRAASTTPRGTVAIQASGGEPPYTFSLITDASNGSVGAGGVYVAGTRGGVVDRVLVSDSTGQTQIVSINVGPGVSVDPATASVPQKGTAKLTASGGTGNGFQWSASDGAVSADGVFTAPSKDEVVQVTVHDSLGNQGTATVSIGSALAVSPFQPSTYPLGTIQLTAVGGNGKYRFAVITDHGGQVDAQGLFTAGRIGNVTESVDVTDDLGNHSATDISVGPGVSITPSTATLDANGQLQLAAAGGSGLGYAFSLDANPSAGTVDQGGLFHAGPNGGLDRVKLVDSVGNEAFASLTVNAPPGSSASPASSSSSSGSQNAAPTSSDDGCSCMTTGAPSGTPWPLLLVGALAFARRRRRR